MYTPVCNIHGRNVTRSLQTCFFVEVLDLPAVVVFRFFFLFSAKRKLTQQFHGHFGRVAAFGAPAHKQVLAIAAASIDATVEELAART